MRKFSLIIYVALGGLLLLSGCNLPTNAAPPSNPQDDQSRIATSAAATMAAALSPTQAGFTPPPVIQPTNTSAVVVTQAPTSTPFPTATSTPSIPCDQASFIKDVTIPDGTDFSPGDTFTKTWRLRNSGSCTWTSGYSLVFDSGDAMGGPAAVQLTTGTVAPNQTVDVSVDLVAPSSPGSYRGYWKLRNSSGIVFGLGASNGPFFVDIDVVAAVNFTIEYENTHICGGLVYATVKITNTGSEFLQSARITVRDLDTDTLLYGPGTNNKPFVTTSTGCPPGNSDADPGETYYIAVSIGASPPSGHEARYVLRLCTEDSLSGTCVEKSVEFTIP